MADRITAADYAHLTRERASKHGAVRTVYAGVTYDSKLEARMAQRLDLMVRLGEVQTWLRQVPLHFASGKRARVDALVFFADGHIEVWEAKGHASRDWPWIEASIRSEYPQWPLRVIRRGDV